MAEIEFSVLKSACYYTDLFMKRKKSKGFETIYYCDNADRVFKEPRCERYCEESKCPLLSNSKKSKCDMCANNDSGLSGECYDCLKGIRDYYEKQ